jgi:hypothetical protein
LEKIKSTDRLVASPEVILHAEFQDWAVLYHPLFDDTIATGPVGVAIWKAFDGRRSLADIVLLIKAEYEDTPDSVFEDTLSFSQELYRRFFILMAPERD